MYEMEERQPYDIPMHLAPEPLELTAQDNHWNSGKSLVIFNKGVRIGAALQQPENLVGRVELFDAAGRHVGVMQNVCEPEWREQAMRVLAWMACLLPDAAGNWFTDEIGLRVAEGPIHWRQPRYPTTRLARCTTVLVPNRRLAGGQMLALVAWLTEHGERHQWDRVGSTFGFTSNSLATHFMLTWQATEIGTYTVPSA